MTDELKPVKCGCGGEAVIYVTHWWGKCYVCECEECGTASRPCNTEAEAVNAWNRAMSGSVEEKLKAFLDGMSAEIKEETNTIDPLEDYHPVRDCMVGTERTAKECAENARCNGMSDLISRQDVIDALELGLENDYVDATKILAYVKQLPSAKPERKNGKWIDGKPYVNSHWRVCSVCHETSPESWGGYNYCPNCGADMRGE